ncbi:MAG TPA: RES family NAD+ phosphorylase [Tabrizicola sp.]
MRLWQLVEPEQLPGLSGEGTKRHGGRWNSPGRPAVYCASSLSLATLEVLVNLPRAQRRKGRTPAQSAVEYEVPDDLCKLSGFPGTLPEEKTRPLGDDWLDSLGCLALSVPSSVVPLEANVVLNPRHPDIGRVKVLRIEPFDFDPRLLDD